MRIPLVVALGLGSVGTVLGQLPGQLPIPGSAPVQPMGPMPGGPIAPPQALPRTAVDGATPTTTPETPGGDPTAILPQKEDLRPIDSTAATLRKFNENWQLIVGGKVFREFGHDQTAAEEALRTMRGLRPTEWASIGSPRTIVEYGLTNGKPAPWVPTPKWSLGFDLRTVRAEPTQGVWVVRDDEAIILNFGTARQDAEQAAAVARKYGFNRVGLIGSPRPIMAYFYAAPIIASAAKSDPGASALARAAQEQALTRTGIPVPGLGFVGERIVIDPRKVEVRKEQSEYVLAHGTDVLARFGQSEWSARDAQKVIQDARFTEFCRVGSAGVTFFLVNGKPPTRVPFSVQGNGFQPTGLKVRANGPTWGVYEGSGRMLFPAANQEEAEQIVRVIQMYGFDQTCQIGLSPRSSLKFLAKSGR